MNFEVQFKLKEFKIVDNSHKPSKSAVQAILPSTKVKSFYRKLMWDSKFCFLCKNIDEIHFLLNFHTVQWLLLPLDIKNSMIFIF